MQRDLQAIAWKSLCMPGLLSFNLYVACLYLPPSACLAGLSSCMCFPLFSCWSICLPFRPFARLYVSDRLLLVFIFLSLTIQFLYLPLRPFACLNVPGTFLSCLYIPLFICTSLYFPLSLCLPVHTTARLYSKSHLVHKLGGGGGVGVKCCC